MSFGRIKRRLGEDLRRFLREIVADTATGDSMLMNFFAYAAGSGTARHLRRLRA